MKKTKLENKSTNIRPSETRTVGERPLWNIRLRRMRLQVC